MKSVYCSVRTGSLNKAVCASYLNMCHQIRIKQCHRYRLGNAKKCRAEQPSRSDVSATCLLPNTTCHCQHRGFCSALPNLKSCEQQFPPYSMFPRSSLSALSTAILSVCLSACFLACPPTCTSQLLSCKLVISRVSFICNKFNLRLTFVRRSHSEPPG